MNDAQGRFDERLKPFRLNRGIELGEHPLHQSEVDRADDVAVGLGDLPERALMQQNPTLASRSHRFRLETDLVENGHELTDCAS